MAILSATFNHRSACSRGRVSRQASHDQSRRLCLAVLGLAVVVGSSGCRRTPGLDVHPVSGTVTVDGDPLAEGWITFRSLEGDTRGCAGRITNGAYRAEAFAGAARIAVTATRAVPGKFVSPAPGVEPQPKTEQFIPRRYNEKTELEAEIPVGGIRGLDFALTLMPADRAAPAKRR
jgi:hypothetical protein